MNKCRAKTATALATLARKAVRFANTLDVHGEAWDTETDLMSAALEYASSLSKQARDRIGVCEP